MALAQYSDLFWYPSGALASGVSVRIFPIDSNILAPLFTDATGNVPLDNPLTTSATGTVEFWAETGAYWMHADSESFEIFVGIDPNDPNAIAQLQVDVLQLQADMNTVEAEVDTLQTDVNAVEANITVVEGDITTLQGDMATVQGDLTALEGVVDLVETLATAGVSTGITAGGDLSVNALSPSAIDIAPLTGFFTDYVTDPFNPVITPVSYAGGTFELDAAALTRTVTWWLLDDTLTVVQQPDKPTNTQTRTHLVLGVTAQDGGTIFVDQSLPIIVQQPANQQADFMDSLGPFSIAGNVITPNGANLMINQTAGTLFSRAFNHFVGPVQTNDPHVNTTQAQTPAQFRYITRNALTFGPLRNTLDVANYDNGGVITPIGGGSGSATIHRLWLFATNTADAQLAFQYGQTVHPSLSAAVAAIGTGSFVTNPLIPGNGALIAHIVATRTATDLSNPTQAVFQHTAKFATP